MIEGTFPSIAFASLFLYAQALYPQKNPGAIVAAGYSPPSLAATAAPGQVIALSTYGIDSRFPRPVIATGFPLPTSLGGLSVALQWLGTSMPVRFARCGPP